MKNLSEREILNAGKNSHLAQIVNRLKPRFVRCQKDYSEKGKLIFKQGQEYKIWIVRYTDVISGISIDFVAIPHNNDADNPNFNFWYRLSHEVFEGHESAPLARVLEIPTDGSNCEETYALIANTSDGTIGYVPSWHLYREMALNYVIAQMGGEKRDYLRTVVGRLVGIDNKFSTMWRITRRLGKGQRAYYYFDVATGQIITWSAGAYWIISPLSSRQAATKLGDSSVSVIDGKMCFNLI